MNKDPSEYGVLGLTESVDPDDMPFEVSRVNNQVYIDGTIHVKEVYKLVSSSRDDDLGTDKQSKEITTRDIQVEKQIDDSTEAYVALTSPEEALYQWLLGEEFHEDTEIVPHESNVTFQSAPIMYIEAAMITEHLNEDKTQIGTLLEWMNGNELTQQVSLTRAIALVLRDEHDVEFGERDSYPR